MSDLEVIRLLLSRVCFLPLRFCLILCPLVLLRKVRIEACLAVEEVPQEHCQRIIPMFSGDIGKRLRIKWLAFRRWWCIVLTELLPKRVKYRPIGLLIRLLVVRAKLHGASEKRLLA